MSTEQKAISRSNSSNRSNRSNWEACGAMLGGIARVWPVAAPASRSSPRPRPPVPPCGRASQGGGGRLRAAGSEAGPVAAQAREGGRSIRGASRRRHEEIWARPTGDSFVKPLSDLYPRLPCRFCNGLGKVVCDICDGKGKFNRGGYHKKNPVSVERIVGSKWTAMERTFGWRHFRVRSKRKGSGKAWFVEMSATCDETTRFWVNLQNLKERERWSMGWLQKVEILDAQNKDTASNLVCKACQGKGQQPCSCTSRDPDETILDIIEV